MLKIKNGIIIEGPFDKPVLHLETKGLFKTIKESEFTTLIVQVPIEDFEAKCYRLTADLADAGIMYGRDYVIARAGYES